MVPAVLRVGGTAQQVEWKTPPTLAPLPASLLYSATAFSVCSTVTSTPVCLTNSRVAEGTWWNKQEHSMRPFLELGWRHSNSRLILVQNLREHQLIGHDLDLLHDKSSRNLICLLRAIKVCQVAEHKPSRGIGGSNEPTVFSSIHHS